MPYTHPEFMNFGDFLGLARAQGKHSNIGYDAPKSMEETQAKLRLGRVPDARLSTAQLQNFTWENANTNTTEAMVDVAIRLVDELPEGTPPDRVLRYWLDTARKEDAARGVIWPTVDPETVAKSGTGWQIFPNFQIGHAAEQHAVLPVPAVPLRPGQVRLRGRRVRTVPARRGAGHRGGTPRRTARTGAPYCRRTSPIWPPSSRA